VRQPMSQYSIVYTRSERITVRDGREQIKELGISDLGGATHGPGYVLNIF